MVCATDDCYIWLNRTARQWKIYLFTYQQRAYIIIYGTYDLFTSYTSVVSLTSLLIIYYYLLKYVWRQETMQRHSKAVIEFR